MVEGNSSSGMRGARSGLRTLVPHLIRAAWHGSARAKEQRRLLTKPRPHRPVLIVEDHADTREMVELFLKIDGFAVCTAADGLEALKCVAEHRPCIILLDISMPRMDGIAFGRALRGHADPALASIPIVLES
jgi:two-component system response regulator PrrA